MSSDDPEPPASFSSLRARFEQLSTGPSSASTSKPPTAIVKGAAAQPPASIGPGSGAVLAVSAGKPKDGPEVVAALGSHPGSAAAAGDAVAEQGAGPRVPPPARPPKPTLASRSSHVPADTVANAAPPPPPPVALPSREPQTVYTAAPPSSAAPDAPVPPPALTRPQPVPLLSRNSTVSGSFRRPAPPPPAARAKPAGNLGQTLSSSAVEAGAPALGTLQPQVPSPAPSTPTPTATPPAPSPALSVKSLASRFNSEGSSLSRPTSASPPRVVASPSPTSSSDEGDPFERERHSPRERQEERASSGLDAEVEDDEVGQDGEDDEVDSSSDEADGGSIYASSPEQSPTLPPRPAIPPRPPAIVCLLYTSPSPRDS